MPAVSQAQQKAMAIAEHAPGKLYARNKGLLKMTQSQLHDFAATPEKGLPKRMRAGKSRRNSSVSEDGNVRSYSWAQTKRRKQRNA